MVSLFPQWSVIFPRIFYSNIFCLALHSSAENLAQNIHLLEMEISRFKHTHFPKHRSSCYLPVFSLPSLFSPSETLPLEHGGINICFSCSNTTTRRTKKTQTQTLAQGFQTCITQKMLSCLCEAGCGMTSLSCITRV